MVKLSPGFYVSLELLNAGFIVETESLYFCDTEVTRPVELL